MSRFDKYGPFTGGFRAPLNAAILLADVGKIQAVSINTSGKVVIGGAAETAIMGVIIAVRPMAANDPIDVMTSGEIVEATKTGGTAFAAGDIVYAHGTTGGVGVVDAVAASGKIIAKMVELNRMVVRCPVATT
jgi:hypothetical protein